VFQHLFIPVDGSAPANVAVALAASLARANGCVVTLCHVIDRSNDLALEDVGIDTVDGRSYTHTLFAYSTKPALTLSRKESRPSYWLRATP
jgi:nucleotide-binding universal stress UspA family protein